MTEDEERNGVEEEEPVVIRGPLSPEVIDRLNRESADLGAIYGGGAIYFDFDGKPIGLGTWSNLFSSPDRIVGYDEVGERVVSTVWIGVDMSHGFGRAGVPIIYETMVFPDAEVMDRYPTWQTARKGHEDAVTLLRATEGTEAPDGD